MVVVRLVVMAVLVVPLALMSIVAIFLVLLLVFGLILLLVFRLILRLVGAVFLLVIVTATSLVRNQHDVVLVGPDQGAFGCRLCSAVEDLDRHKVRCVLKHAAGIFHVRMHGCDSDGPGHHQRITVVVGVVDMLVVVVVNALKADRPSGLLVGRLWKVLHWKEGITSNNMCQSLSQVAHETRVQSTH